MVVKQKKKITHTRPSLLILRMLSRWGFSRVEMVGAPTEVGDEVDQLGVGLRVGLYNSFAALAAPGRARGGVEVSADPHSGVVHALWGSGFASVHFHAESILTTNGIDVLESLIVHALNSAPSNTGTGVTGQMGQLNARMLSRGWAVR